MQFFQKPSVNINILLRIINNKIIIYIKYGKITISIDTKMK